MSWRAPALIILLVAALYAVVRPWLLDRVGGGLLVAVAVGLALAVSLGVAAWQAHHRRYACPACGHTFPLSVGRHLLGQNWFGRVGARCPACGAVNDCEPAGGAS